MASFFCEGTLEKTVMCGEEIGQRSTEDNKSTDWLYRLAERHCVTECDRTKDGMTDLTIVIVTFI